jgi:hypothetical protein
MIFVLFFLFHLELFSSSVINQPNATIFGEVSLDPSFISLLQENNSISMPLGFADEQYDPPVFGDETLCSIFYKLKFLVDSPDYLDSPKEDQDAFDLLIKENLYQLVHGFYKLHPERLVRLALNSDFSIQMLIINIETFNHLVLDFTNIMRWTKFVKENDIDFKDLKGKKLPENSWIFTMLNPECFIKKNVWSLLKQRIVSDKEWVKRKEIIRLHLQLIASVASLFDACWSFYSYPPVAGMVKKYTFVMDNFSVINEKEVSLSGYQNVKKQLRHIAKLCQKTEGEKTKILESGEDLLTLFILYSHHFIYTFSKGGFAPIDIETYSLGVMMKEKKMFKEVWEEFLLCPDSLLYEAINSIQADIRDGIKAGQNEYLFHKRSYIIEECQEINEEEVEKFHKYLHDYAVKNLDYYDPKCGLDRQLIRILMHLLITREQQGSCGWIYQPWTFYF